MRLLTICRSMAPRETGRLDLALARGLFLVVAFVILLPAAWMTSGWPAAGAALHLVFSGLSLLLAAFLAARLGGDGVGDVRSGLLPLLFLAGVQPRQWLAVRLVQMWAGFASVWIVRAPLLLFVFSLGGVSVARMLAVELLLLLAFLMLSSLGLLGSFKAKSRQQVYVSCISPVLAWEILLLAPGTFLPLLARYYQWSVSAGMTESLDAIAKLTLVARFRAALVLTLPLSEIWPTVAMYSLLAVLVLVRYCRLIAAVSRGTDVISDGESPEAVRPKGRLQRASRRCWDDALAWQAFCIHGSGQRLVQVKCVLYALTGLVLLLSLALPSGYFEWNFAVAAVTCGILMLIGVNKPGDCLAREIREETLPALILTPHDPDDYYAGWQRGGLYLAWPEIALAAVLAGVSYALHAVAPVIVVSIAAAILLSGPFLMLSPLVPFTPAGIATGLGLTFVAFLIAILSIICGAVAHPAAAPVVLIPLALLFNLVLRRYVLPYWMKAKVSSIV